ncbi:MAG: hypothetical protein Tsb0014_09890 [Pleurocapsa sp.]
MDFGIFEASCKNRLNGRGLRIAAAIVKLNNKSVQYVQKYLTQVQFIGIICAKFLEYTKTRQIEPSLADQL